MFASFIKACNVLVISYATRQNSSVSRGAAQADNRGTQILLDNSVSFNLYSKLL